MWGADGMQMPGWHGNDGNAAYLDKTLRHQPIELALDESVSGLEIWRMFARATLVSLFVMVAFFTLAIVVALLQGLSDSSGDSGLGGFGYAAAGTLVKMGTFVSTAVFWILFLVLRHREPVGEWRVLLADSADRTTSVYTQIAGTVRKRQIPVNVSYRRVATGLGRREVSSRLILTYEDYTAYVSVFPYGTGLYLGWMMWRNRRGAKLVVQFFADLVGTLLGRTDPEGRMLRTESARAMREGVHAACREGLYVALDGRDVPAEFGFPDGLPPIDEQRVPVAHASRTAPAGPVPAPGTGPRPWPSGPAVPPGQPGQPWSPSQPAPPGQPWPQQQFWQAEQPQQSYGPGSYGPSGHGGEVGQSLPPGLPPAPFWDAADHHQQDIDRTYSPESDNPYRIYPSQEQAHGPVSPWPPPDEEAGTHR
ncbi:hypothetical protein [Frankia sp. R82]|uniref:hypothetical protein n=1 Tax=Frankia sp. R82 TaxID=2950553 RepID=UPI0020447E69|nr:hypothetical protein [Frankia sp. R82]MCM3884213.1 hypothetical protein [Frankia sp. R82]